MAKIKVLESDIAVVKDDYISLTDIAKHKDSQEANDIIRNTIEFLGTWEKIYNDDFKPVKFDGFKKEAGLNSFTLSSKRFTSSIYLIQARGGR